jgi:hypothetical protein
MTRLTLALAIAAALALAVALGWAAHWAIARRRPGHADAETRFAEAVARLHAVEAERDAPRRRAETAEAARAAVEAEADHRLAAALAETRAELRAAMDGLGDARREAADWRRAYEGLLREDRDDP